MNFGIPKQRTSRKEKELYPNTPVLTVTAQATGEDGSKKSRPISLNTKAIEVLGLGDDAKIAFSFENGIFITNGDNDLIPEEHRLRVTKGYPRKINDKKTAIYISKVKELDDSVDNHFGLVQVNPDGDEIILFGLQRISDVATTEETATEEVVVEADEMAVAFEADAVEQPLAVEEDTVEEQVSEVVEEDTSGTDAFNIDDI